VTLHLYIARQLLFALLLALLELFGVLLPPLVVSAVTRLGGVKPIVLLEYLPYMVVEIAPYVATVAFLVSVMRTFGAMREHGEWTAITMSGIHPARSLPAALTLALLLTGLGLHAMRSEFPALRRAQNNMQRQSVLEKIRALMPGQTSIQIGPVSIVARARTGNRFEGVVLRVADPETGKERRLAAAWAEATFEEDALKFTCTDVQVIEESESFYVDWLEVPFSLDKLWGFQPVDPDRAKYQPSSELRRRVRSGEVEGRRALSYVYEAHRRDALATTFLVFLLIGFSVGLWLGNESHVKSLVIAALLSAFYFIGENLVDALSMGGQLPPVLGAWLPTGVYLVVGLVMTGRVFRR